MLWVGVLSGNSLFAAWPQELFQKSYVQMNNKIHEGRYFVTGPEVQTGTFRADFKMPKSISWTMVNAASKLTSVFEWNTQKGIVSKSTQQKDSPDDGLSVLDTVLGRMAVQSMLGTVNSWTKVDSLESQSVQMSVQFEEGRQVLSIVPKIPLLTGYTWKWIIDNSGKDPKVLQWRFLNESSEYLFEFQGEKK